MPLRSWEPTRPSASARVFYETRIISWQTIMPTSLLGPLFGWYASQQESTFEARALAIRTGLVCAAMSAGYILDDPARSIEGTAPEPLRIRMGVRLAIGGLWLGACIMAVLLLASLRVNLGGRSLDEAPVPWPQLWIEAFGMISLTVAVSAAVRRLRDNHAGLNASITTLIVFAATHAIPSQWSPWAVGVDRWVEIRGWWIGMIVISIAATLVNVWDVRNTRTRLPRLGRNPQRRKGAKGP